jgi:AhpD family alkylhydroperoxidase
MSRISIPSTVAASPAASQPLLEAVKKQLGTVPNLHRLISQSPVTLEGYLGLGDALGKGSLDVRVRQRIAVRVAQLNGCDYCLSAHTYLGKNLSKLSDADLQAARTGRSPDPKAEAVLQFVTDVMKAHGHIGNDSLLAARSAGLTDAQLIEVIGHIALNTFTNLLNSVAQTEIDFPLVSAEQISTQAA